MRENRTQRVNRTELIRYAPLGKRKRGMGTQLSAIYPLEYLKQYFDGENKGPTGHRVVIISYMPGDR